MSFAKWLSLGAVGLVVAACGGGVSLGSAGSNLGDSGEGDGGQGDAGPGAGQCCPRDSATSGSMRLGGSAKNGCVVTHDFACSTNWRVEQDEDGCEVWRYDVGPCPAPVCFDPKSGALDPALKACKTAADCVVVLYQENCCGTMHAAGVSSSKKADVEKCAADRAASFPGCGCPQLPTQADDGSSDPGGATAQVTCNSAGKCETTFDGVACGKNVCTKGQTCCAGVPLPEPTCVDGNMCPVSQRKMKKDITYLAEADKERLRSELMSFPLATYRYKTESATDRAHLGFIIDDVAPSPAVLPSGERVDLYGYSTMTVATLQLQAREIAELKQEVEALRREVAKKRR